MEKSVPDSSPERTCFFQGCLLPGERLLVDDALVPKYLSHELVGNISRESTAIVGREKPAKKVKEPKKPKK